MSKLTSLVLLSIFLTACGGGSGGSDPAPTPIPTPTPAPDTTAPVISLNGDTSLQHEQGTTFVDPGATATDETDGTVNVTVSGEVGSLAGTYTLTYTASDAAGNTSSESRQVIVADTQPPVLSLLGPAVVTLPQGQAYEEQGATAIDLVDGNVQVTISGSVNTSVAASYSLSYSAIDVAGNQANTSRTVEVTPPVNDDELSVFQAGGVAPDWDGGLNAFDSAIGFSECNNDNGAACPSINWDIVDDTERGNVLEIEHSDSGQLAGFFIKSTTPVDVSAFRNGALLFDLKTLSGDGRYTMKIDCVFPCTSGDQLINFVVDESWNAVTVPLIQLEQAGLNLSNVDTGIVIWATSHQSNVFRIDNVRFADTFSGESSIGGTTPPSPGVEYSVTQYGAGSISDTINPASYRCVFDFGNWIYNAGVVAPGIPDCDTSTGTPIGEPTPLYPQVSGEAAQQPIASHRWWGSVSFMGEMTILDANSAAYITPDPITARVSNAGFRMMGIPAGLQVFGIDFGYRIPDPFAEVFDGIAIANSLHSNMQAYAETTSDGSITVEWQANDNPVMTATFVHGSPYVYVEMIEGNLQLKTLREDGGEKGVYHQDTDSLGLWTSVAGNTNHYLISGDDNVEFNNASGNLVTVESASNSYTITLMPTTSTTPNDAMITFFKQFARTVVDRVQIDYQINASTQAVDITHQYLNSEGDEVTTLTGLQPLHWKNITSTFTDTGYQVRSARGITKFTNQSRFTYALPHVGVLPKLPTFTDELDVAKLTALVDEFLAVPNDQWNTLPDTYWSGKAYGKVSELIGIADALGLDDQKAQLLDWLKAELEDWFTAETDDSLDTNKYFVYDTTWNTLLGMEESFASHQQLNDHHFHYGYFVRAAAEICRHESSWCSDENYGPMVELLIRDYAGGRDDPMFPYLRHFDPANGFSWASGNVNFVRGNNNESTSEAANAYGAMVLFGLITENQEIIDRGIYLHASTASSYWEYWNNIDGYQNTSAEADNFPEGYDNITTSIVWGDGAVFSTWFSAAYAHILGIQGLPTNALNLHIGIHADYLIDYVDLGLFESSNDKPSGLIADQWRDIWWNIWAMTDAEASIADYNSVTSYVPEAGESKAHTYHWIHTFKELGHMTMGTGELTADYPAAMAFNNEGVMTYVVYNYQATEITVRFSDGTEVTAAPGSFTVSQN